MMKFAILAALASTLASGSLRADPWVGEAPEQSYLMYLQAMPDCDFAAAQIRGQSRFQPCGSGNIDRRANRFEPKQNNRGLE